MTELARAYRVELCGIHIKDRNALKRIFAITKDRSRSYSLVNSTDKLQADIRIINADNPKAKKKWNADSVEMNKDESCATILASRNKLENVSYNSTILPFFPTRLLKSLDELAHVEQNSLPKKVILDSKKNLGAVSDNPTFENKAQLSAHEYEAFIDKNNNAQKNALVVDDSRSVRKALDTKLRVMNYSVQHAASGREALWLLQKKRFDSVFLDVVMPGIDGYEVCKQIKRNKSTKHIPVIMLTSLSSQFDKVKGKLAGCDTYLTKPIEHEKFEDVVTRYLN